MGFYPVGLSGTKASPSPHHVEGRTPISHHRSWTRLWLTPVESSVERDKVPKFRDMLKGSYNSTKLSLSQE